MVIAQEAQCPTCKWSWDLQIPQFVRTGDAVMCPRGCGEFPAGESTIRCVAEDARGLVEVVLTPTVI